MIALPRKIDYSHIYLLIFFGTLVISIISLLSSYLAIKFLGVLLGIFAISLFFNLISVYLITHDIAGDSLKVQQEKRIAINLPYSRAYDLCLEALNQKPEMKIMKNDKERGEIFASISLPWWNVIDNVSYYSADLVTINIKKISEQHNHIQISSKPNS